MGLDNIKDYSETFDNVKEVRAVSNRYYLKVEKRYPYGYVAKVLCQGFVADKLVAEVAAFTYQGAIKKGRRLYEVIIHEPVYVEYFTNDKEGE